MIDVILTPKTRPACGGPQLIYYSAAGVFLSISQKGLNARFIDLMPEDVPGSSYLPENNVADFCCYAVFFGNKVTAFDHMQKVRKAKKAPQRIIAFGPFASEFPQEILSRGLADIVVSGDPEFVIPIVLEKGGEPNTLSAIPNLYYMHEGQIVYTRKHSYPDLDQIPFISPYLHEQGHRPALIMTARGCQYHCVFCDRNTLWGGGVRNRSIENVLSEIKEIVETQHAKEIIFLDEDLAADHKRLIALCDGMRRIRGDFSWKCSSCVNSVSEKTLMLMGHSRCRGIHLGVESASPEVLRRIGKVYGREEILNAVHWSQKAGLKVEIMLTIGNPGETDHDREMTLSVLNEIGPDVTTNTNRLVIIPGTALYRRGLREGWFTQKSFFEDDGIIFFDEQKQLAVDRIHKGP